MKCSKKEVVLCVAVCALLFTGCSFVYKEWDKIKDGDDIEALEKFRNKYSDNEYKKKAEVRIWEVTKERDNIIDYDAFMSKHSDSEYYEHAEKRRETLLWNKLVEENEIKPIMSIAIVSKDPTFRDQTSKIIEEIISKRGTLLSNIENELFRKGFENIILQMAMLGIYGTENATFNSCDDKMPSFTIKEYVALRDMKVVYCDKILVQLEDDNYDHEYSEICYFKGYIYRIEKL